MLLPANLLASSENRKLSTKKTIKADRPLTCDTLNAPWLLTDNSNWLVMVIRNYHWLNLASRVLISTCSAPLVQTEKRKQTHNFCLTLTYNPVMRSITNTKNLSYYKTKHSTEQFWYNLSSQPPDTHLLSLHSCSCFWMAVTSVRQRTLVTSLFSWPLFRLWGLSPSSSFVSSLVTANPPHYHNSHLLTTSNTTDSSMTNNSRVNKIYWHTYWKNTIW